MKNYDRKIPMHCPLCGNDQFSYIDEQFEEMDDVPDNAKIKCSDCNSIFTKEELINENAEAIDIAVEEVANEVMKDLEKQLKGVFKNWKF